MSATGTLISIGTIAGIYALLALALNIKFGETGILDFGHVAFYLVGAYAAALFVMPPPEEFAYQNFLFGLNLHNYFIELTGIEILGAIGWSIAVIIAMIAAAFLGLVVALPAIRLRADYLAIALLGVSVIAVRVVQTENWLANGPDALRGYPRPFAELIPLPSSSPSAAFLLGLVVMVVWLMILYLLARTDLQDDLQGPAGRGARGLLWITTLGAGFWAVRRTRATIAGNDQLEVPGSVTVRHYLPVIGVALGFGVVAFGLAIVELGSEAILLFLGMASLAAWVVAGLKVREHYLEYTRKSALAGLLMAIGLVVALAPTMVLGGVRGPIGYVGAILSFGLLGVYGYGIYRLYGSWERFDVPGRFVGIIGITVLWLMAIRYWVSPLTRRRSVQGMIDSTVENLFVLVDFHATLGPSFDYRRFLFILVLATVLASFILLERLRMSPYGRVLRAIRDDENVAMSLGKNTFYYKVQAMVIGGAFAGLAGALAAVHFRSLGFALFNPIITFFIFLAVILGGKANNKGVILGAVLYWVFVRATVELSTMFPGPIGGRIDILRNAIIGMLLIFILYYQPEGIWPEERTVVEVSNQ